MPVEFGSDKPRSPYVAGPNYEYSSPIGQGEQGDRLAAASRNEEMLAQQQAERNRRATEQQLADYTRQAQADAYSMAGLSGADPSRLRAGAMAAGDIRQQSAMQAELMRSVEQQAAQRQLMDVYQRRGQYAQQAGANAADWYGQQQSQSAAAEEQRAQEAIASSQATAEWVGMTAGAGGSYLQSMSDRSLKEQIQQASPREQDAALRSLTEQLGAEGRKTNEQLSAASIEIPSYTYQYRPEAAGLPGVRPGQRFGPMAQDLEQHPYTAPMVMDTPQGKTVDTTAAAVGSLGLASRANQRVDELEQQLAAAGATTDAELRRARQRGVKP